MANIPSISPSFYVDAAPVFILCLGSLLAMIQGLTKKYSSPSKIAVVLLSSIFLAFAFALASSSGLHHLNSAVVSDNLARFASVLILVTAFSLVFLVWDSYLREDFFYAEVSCLFQMILVGMIVFVSSHDLVSLFVGMELSSIGLYALIGYIKPSRLSVEGAIKYLVLGSVASAVMLFGFAFLYAFAGSLNIEQIVTALVKEPSQILAQAGVVFVFSGIAFKLALAPFHLWAPDVYESAPTVLTAFMATAVKVMVLVFIVRFSMLGLNFSETQWLPVLTFMAFLSMLAGNVMALVQSNLKRMLAYSSIAHSGYMTIAICVMGVESLPLQALLFYVTGYTIASLMAFAVIMWFENEQVHNLQLDDLNGLAKKHPWACVALAASVFSLAGMPPTVGFMSKFFVFNVAIQKELYALVLVGVFASAISLFYYLRLIVHMFMKEREKTTWELTPKASKIYALSLSVLFVASIALGTVSPSYFLNKIIEPTVATVALKP